METLENNIKTKRRRKSLKPAQIIVLGFATIILIGGFLLCLPISSTSGTWTNYIDALFTATSAVCVTGLTTVSVGYHFSWFGQIILLILIQAGGLGFMTITTLVMLLIRKKIMFRERIVLQSALGYESNKGVLKLVYKILIMTLIIEGVGAVLLMPVFIYDFGAIGIWHSIFMSISAFCNAGFDLFGASATDYPSLIAYVSNPYVTLVIAGLIILGGLGFIVIMDITHNKFRYKKLRLHSKIVLVGSGILILAGWIFFFCSEFTNVDTLGSESLATKIFASFFQSVTSRTAGFCTIDPASMTSPSKLFCSLLMFIGTSPGSTGGGIKTTTMALVILAVVSGIASKDKVVISKRTIGARTIYRAIAIATMALGLVITLTIFLQITQANIFVGEIDSMATLANVLFDSMSAFSTTGLSTGLMPFLNNAGKVAVMLTMFIGRVGLIPLGLLFVSDKEDDILQYPEVSIPIG